LLCRVFGMHRCPTCPIVGSLPLIGIAGFDVGKP
jgi:hypothetical protein